jgi:hypothetical protein
MSAHEDSNSALDTLTSFTYSGDTKKGGKAKREVENRGQGRVRGHSGLYGAKGHALM